MSAVTKYVPDGRYTVEPGVGEPRREQVALRREVGGEPDEVLVGQAQPHGGGVLERRAVHVGEELLHRAHGRR